MINLWKTPGVATVQSATIDVNEPAPAPLGRRADPWVQSVTRNRELLRSLIVRNLRVKYQRSVLGFVWTLLSPMFMVGVLALVFSQVFRIGMPHYWAFLVSGYFVWSFTVHTLSSGTYILCEHASLSRNIAFPGESLVIGAAASRLIEFSIELLLVVLVVSLLHHHSVPASLVMLPALIAIQLLLAVGLTFPIATMSVFYSDVQHALPVALTTLFYLSPVFYSLDMVPESLRPFFSLNPMAGVLTLYHDVLYRGQLPSLSTLGIAFLTASTTCVIGYGIFRRHKAVFAEVL